MNDENEDIRTTEFREKIFFKHTESLRIPTNQEINHIIEARKTWENQDVYTFLSKIETVLQSIPVLERKLRSNFQEYWTNCSVDIASLNDKVSQLASKIENFRTSLKTLDEAFQEGRVDENMVRLVKIGSANIRLSCES
jgi:phage-related protein